MNNNAGKYETILKNIKCPKKLRSMTNLKILSKITKKKITIFDLETTTYNPYVDWMGITEFAYLTISPDGQVKHKASLVNPERNIPPKVRELTGITNEDVANFSNWSKWTKEFHKIAKEHVVVGYNCASFDCNVILKQNERYGLKETKFEEILDAMALPDVSGKLVEAATSHGITAKSYHRAMADVLVTSYLVESVIEKNGVDEIKKYINAPVKFKSNKASGGFSPKKKRQEEISEYYEKHGNLPDLEVFAKERNIKKGTVESDVMVLIEQGKMPNSILENSNVQDWLSVRIEEAIDICWVGEDEFRLKPLFVYFEEKAPAGFDYTQLKIALKNSGFTSSPREKRQEELTNYYEKHGCLPDLEVFAKERNIKKETVESEIIPLIQQGKMPNSIIENKKVQEWLSTRIKKAIETCWVGEDKNKLKPLFVYFEEKAPTGFTYNQLKLALKKRNSN